MPKSLATTSAVKEDLAPIDIELGRFFDQSDSVIHLRISDFLRETTVDARTRIEQVFRSESRHRLQLKGTTT